MAGWLTALAFSSASFALAPYDATGATVELVPVAGGAAVASARITFPPDADMVNLAIPPAVISALAPGASVSYLARVASDALTAGSTCNANTLSRQVTFTKAGGIAQSVPAVGALGLIVLAMLIGVTASRNVRVRGILTVAFPVVLGVAFWLAQAPVLNAQANDPNTTYASSPDDAIQSVRAVVDGAGNVAIAAGRATECQFALPQLPASLPDVGPIDDRGGITPYTFSIVMPPLLDETGSQIAYVVTGLPQIGLQGPVTWNVSQIGNIISISSDWVGFVASGEVSTLRLSVTSPSAVGSTEVRVLIRII